MIELRFQFEAAKNGIPMPRIEDALSGDSADDAEAAEDTEEGPRVANAAARRAPAVVDDDDEDWGFGSAPPAAAAAASSSATAAAAAATPSSPSRMRSDLEALLAGNFDEDENDRPIPGEEVVFRKYVRRGVFLR
jgi:hypothetical protein